MTSNDSGPDRVGDATVPIDDGRVAQGYEAQLQAHPAYLAEGGGEAGALAPDAPDRCTGDDGREGDWPSAIDFLERELAKHAAALPAAERAAYEAGYTSDVARLRRWVREGGPGPGLGLDGGPTGGARDEPGQSADADEDAHWIAGSDLTDDDIDAALGLLAPDGEPAAAREPDEGRRDDETRGRSPGADEVTGRGAGAGRADAGIDTGVDPLAPDRTVAYQPAPLYRPAEYWPTHPFLSPDEVERQEQLTRWHQDDQAGFDDGAGWSR